MIDQNTRSVTSVFMVLAVLVMGALAYSVSQRNGDSLADQPLLYPDLADSLNDIDTLTVTAAENVLVAELQKVSTEDSSSWIVSNADNYPADIGKLRSLLLTLAEARMIEQKTSTAEYYGRLGVADIKDPEATGVQLDIAAPSAVSLIIGNSGINGDYSYARRAGEAESWLVSGVLTTGRQTSDWLDRKIVSLTADRIRKVTITHADGDALTISKASVEDPAFVLENMPADGILSYEGILNSIAGAATELEFESLVGAEELDLQDIAPTVVSFVTFDDLIVNISIYESGEQKALTVSATGTTTDAEMEARAINARTAERIYAVPGYKIDPLLKRQNELLKSS